MVKPTVVTRAIKARIRELRSLGVPYARIAKDMGLSPETVLRHSSDIHEKVIKARQKARYERERNNPEVLERRRKTAREYAKKKREEYKASGVRVDRVTNTALKGSEATASAVTTRGNIDLDQFVDELLVTDKVILDTLGGE